jgi:translation initiation factor 2 alpha subunit (eIF-2alpha)
MVFLYKNKNPEIGEIAICRVTEINKFNIVTTLVDYDNMTGYISYSELSRKKRYNLHKIVNIGKDVIVQVIGFNNVKNFVELSIRTINVQDIEYFNKIHRKYIGLYNLWRYVYMKMNPDLEMNIEKIDSKDITNFMENTFWKIEKILEKEKINDEDTLDDIKKKEDLTEDDNIKENLSEDDNIKEDYKEENLKENFLEEYFNTMNNPSTNSELLKYIDKYDTVQIKKILDEYSNIKTVLVKQSKTKEFNICSFDCEGLENIKNALDYKTYDKYSELIDKYEIAILYLAGGKYSLTIKQKNPIDENINIVFDYLIEKIKSNSENNGIVFSI